MSSGFSSQRTREGVCVHVCVGERKCEAERVCVCVCVCERERERGSVYVGSSLSRHKRAHVFQVRENAVLRQI